MTPQQVTDFLAQTKTTAGIARWQEDNSRTNTYRLILPLFVEQSAQSPNFMINFHGNAPQPRVTYLISIPPCVCRLDLDPTARHNNGPKKFRSAPGGWIHGHNYHSWENNRPSRETGRLPLNFDPNHVVAYTGDSTFEGALQWFCNENNIDIDISLIPALPELSSLPGIT